MTNFDNSKPDTVNETTGSGRERGFTMIEVMIVLVVVAILVAVAAPGFQNLIGNNRIISEVYTLRATLNNARSEAMARRASVVVCPSTDGAACADSDDWSTGYIAFVDTVRDNAADPNDPDEEIIQVEGEERAVDIAFNNAARLVRFNSQGVALGFDGAFTFCDDRGDENARALIVNPVGTVRAATDTDSPGDNIVNVGSANAACN